MENASATQVTSGTIVTAQQTSVHAGPRMGRSAVTVATASVGSASVQSPEPLGRRVRSAQLAQMLAAPRGKGLFSTLAPGCPSAGSPPQPASCLHTGCWPKLVLTVTKTIAVKCWGWGGEGALRGKKSKTVHKSKIIDPF